jgi:hypothetical protein
LIADFEGNGAVWQDDIPPDLIAEADSTKLPAKDPEPPKKPRPSHLKLVK